MYRVLSSRPLTHPTGEKTYAMDKGRAVTLNWERVVNWPEQGIAKDMQDAKRKFGGAPVLAPIEAVH